VLEREVLGPILHVLQHCARDLERLVDSINATGYGPTFGIRSCIDSTVRRVASLLAMEQGRGDRR
jgi:RHH-type proline utilization regulon transcriptional repressor/proline dehydrogenase/delta 1-pyrroline-5-carboxylate dehydrogenase